MIEGKLKNSSAKIGLACMPSFEFGKDSLFTEKGEKTIKKILRFQCTQLPIGSD